MWIFRWTTHALAIFSIVGIFQFFFWDQVTAVTHFFTEEVYDKIWYGHHRASSFYDSPTLLAIECSIGIMFGLYFFICEKKKIYFWDCIVLWLGVLSSGTRSEMINVVFIILLGVIVCQLLHKSKKGIAVLIICGIVSSMIFYAISLVTECENENVRIVQEELKTDNVVYETIEKGKEESKTDNVANETIEKSKEGSRVGDTVNAAAAGNLNAMTNGRISIWKFLLNETCRDVESILFGIGNGMSELVTLQRGNTAFGPHSGILGLLCETGAVGTVLFFLFVIEVIKRVRKKPSNEQVTFFYFGSGLILMQLANAPLRHDVQFIVAFYSVLALAFADSKEAGECVILKADRNNIKKS